MSLSLREMNSQATFVTTFMFMWLLLFRYNLFYYENCLVKAKYGLREKGTNSKDPEKVHHKCDKNMTGIIN